MANQSSLFPHKEFTIKILAPTEVCKCIFLSQCRHEGTYHFLVENDHGLIVMSIDPICEHHLIQAFIEAFEEA